jgi:hypothetical protein
MAALLIQPEETDDICYFLADIKTVKRRPCKNGLRTHWAQRTISDFVAIARIRLHNNFTLDHSPRRSMLGPPAGMGARGIMLNPGWPTGNSG